MNDKNRVLIEAYLHIRDDLDELTSDLAKIEKKYYSLLDLEIKAEYYYKQRAVFNTLNERSIRRTALFIFLNKTGYNGMYRENSKGSYNIPFGKQSTPVICDYENLKLVSSVLKHVDIKCGSYEKSFAEAAAGDFIYLDPPYEPLNRTSSFTQYQAGGFVQDDQRKLAQAFSELSERGCFVMMSNSTAELIYELYSEFYINKITVSRGISANKSAKGKIEELIITNYEPLKGLYQTKNSGAK